MTPTALAALLRDADARLVAFAQGLLVAEEARLAAAGAPDSSVRLAAYFEELRRWRIASIERIATVAVAALAAPDPTVH